MKLYEALAELAAACGGPFAFVIDAGNGLWCAAYPGRPPITITPRADEAADRFYAAEIVPREAEMRHGAKLDVVKVHGDDRYAAISFAAIYVVVVWFDGDFNPWLVRARIREALPRIEKLVLALPPSGGPTANEGAGKMRA